MASLSAKHAVIVCGAESTGTRLLTELFIEAGFAGESGHAQRWDVSLPTEEPLVVWRRSLPHRGEWPDLRAMVTQLVARGYAVTGCVVTRDWYAAIRSQVRIGHVQTAAAALANLRRAYAEAPATFQNLGVPYVLVPYEALVARPWQAPATLLQLCGIASGSGGHWIPVVDENEKYYDSLEMLTPEQRAKLQALNTDHHRRMSILAGEHQRQNRMDVFQRLDDRSRAALLAAVKGCEARYGMRTEPASVLELGASFGGERPFLLSSLGASEYVGVEIVEAAAATSPYVQHCAVEDMPAEWAGRFSYIWSRHVMEHVVDLDIALDALRRVLAPNGIIAAVTPHLFPDSEPAHVTQLRMAEWIAAYERHGLHVVYGVLGEYVCTECHLVAIHDSWPRLE